MAPFAPAKARWTCAAVASSRPARVRCANVRRVAVSTGQRRAAAGVVIDPGHLFATGKRDRDHRPARRHDLAADLAARELPRVRIEIEPGSLQVVELLLSQHRARRHVEHIWIGRALRELDQDRTVRPGVTVVDVSGGRRHPADREPSGDGPRRAIHRQVGGSARRGVVRGHFEGSGQGHGELDRIVDSDGERLRLAGVAVSVERIDAQRVRAVRHLRSVPFDAVGFRRVAPDQVVVDEEACLGDADIVVGGRLERDRSADRVSG